ncbi:MAG: hypothetical protein R2814_17840 [Flavobacteriaceae bacterium]
MDNPIDGDIEAAEALEEERKRDSISTAPPANPENKNGTKKTR